MVDSLLLETGGTDALLLETGGSDDLLLELFHSQDFAYTGSYQTFVVPTGVTTVTCDLYGGAGGSADTLSTAGGLGGRVKCDLTVTPGETLRIYVGGAGQNGTPGVTPTPGFNGGGASGGAGGAGGGATDVRRTPYALADRLVIAPAGGGAGGNNSGGGGQGGGGGTPTGTDGTNGVGSQPAGDGGTASAGGLPGNPVNSQQGQFGVGGFGSASNPRSGGGGGGGKWGGGGAEHGGLGQGGGGGGGGSGVSTGVNETIEDGVRAGNGTATIEWELPDDVSGVLTGSFGSLTAAAEGGPPPQIDGTLAASLGSLTGTMVGLRIVSGVLTANFGSLDGLIRGNVTSPHYWEAELQRSSWRADLSVLVEW